MVGACAAPRQLSALDFGGKFKLALRAATRVADAGIEVGAITFEFLARGTPSIAAALPATVVGVADGGGGEVEEGGGAS